MHGTDPTQIPAVTYVWVGALSLLSAIATYLHRLKQGRPLKRPLVTLAFDIAYCLMAGLLTYYLCEASHLDGMQTAALVSIGSHMGARLIFTLQMLVIRQAARRIDPEERT